MSLRSFHLIFISIATIFCIAVAVWSLYFNAQSTDMVVKIMGWTCAVVGVVLPIYGAIFFKKSKQQHLTT